MRYRPAARKITAVIFVISSRNKTLLLAQKFRAGEKYGWNASDEANQAKRQRIELKFELEGKGRAFSQDG
jgi:hypothetical protein